MGGGGAEIVEEVFAADAESGLQRGGWVVEACVDDFGVAAGCFCAEGRVAFEQDGGGVWAGEGEVAGDGEADDAAADYLVLWMFGLDGLGVGMGKGCVLLMWIIMDIQEGMGRPVPCTYRVCKIDIGICACRK